MPKSTNQKLKALYLLKILYEKTDEAHYLTVNDILNELGRYDISAERKSIYADIAALRNFGVDIEHVSGKDGGYYVASRLFQLPELKLLVDSVQASKFLTHKKSRELIKKLESLTSVYQGKSLHRQVYLKNQIKTMNESIYYNVDGIHHGIHADRMLQFRYLEDQLNKEKGYRRGGKYYFVSPFMLVYDDSYYYMVGYDPQEERIKHYRVDKMTDITVTEQPRSGKDVFKAEDPTSYSQKCFSMYGGEEESVRICCQNKMIGIILDRFGRDIMVIRKDPEHFEVTVKVALSPVFYSWVFSLENQVVILEPEHAVQAYQSMLKLALPGTEK